MEEGEEGGLPKEAEKEANRYKKQIEELQQYVKAMTYQPVKPPKASEKTESLAVPKKKNILGTYTENKDVLAPPGRRERVERIVAKYKLISTEQLENIIKQYRKKNARSEEQKKKQQIFYFETLTKLRKQCENQLMHAIVERFGREVAKKANLQPTPKVQTQAFQYLQKALVCQMYLTLKVPNEQQTLDYTIYNKLAAVLSDLILQALFLAQNIEEETPPPKEVPEEVSDKDRCIKVRALRAAKKKLCQNQRKSLVGKGSKCFSIYSH